MALPFFKSKANKRDQVMVFDLGSRTTKAVYLLRRNESYCLAGFAVQEAPSPGKHPTPEQLAEHLKKMVQAMGCKSKQVILVLGVSDSLVRQVEMPMVPISDMRMMLKFNSKSYLQQELVDYVFDCYILPPRGLGFNQGTEPGKGTPKCKVMVGGAKKQLIEELSAGIRTAGFVPDQIVPSLITPINAFEMAQPDTFLKEVVALVDIGFRNTFVNILQAGDPMLNRVVPIGGDKLTTGLAEAMSITYPEAEGIKVGMPQEVASTLQPLLTPLGRELRASIDFFEHQHDKAVSQVFVSGGSARSDFIIQTLQSELMVPCKPWNPTGFLELALPSQQMAEIEQVNPQLAVAVGAAVAAC